MPTKVPDWALIYLTAEISLKLPPNCLHEWKLTMPEDLTLVHAYSSSYNFLKIKAKHPFTPHICNWQGCISTVNQTIVCMFHLQIYSGVVASILYTLTLVLHSLLHLNYFNMLSFGGSLLWFEYYFFQDLLLDD